MVMLTRVLRLMPRIKLWRIQIKTKDEKGNKTGKKEAAKSNLKVIYILLDHENTCSAFFCMQQNIVMSSVR